MTEQELIQESIRRGDHLWYVVAVNTNSRAVNIANTPIIYTVYGDACIMSEQITNEIGTPHVPMRVSDYNNNFRRFMELD